MNEEKYYDKFFENIVENLPYAVFLIDRDYLFKYVNKTFEVKTGYKLEELKNKKYDILLEENQAEMVKNSIEKAKKEKMPERIEFEIKTKEGGKIYVRVYFIPFFVEDEFLGIMGTGRDTGEIKKIERKCKEFFDNIPVGLYRTTPDGKFMLANKKLLEILGFSSFEELEKLDLEKNGYHPDSPREVFKKIVEEKGELKNYEAKWRKKNGTVIYIRENARTVKDESGKVIFYEGTVEDITKEKEAEEKLKQRTRELVSIFSAIPDLFFRINKDGVIVDYIAGSKEELYISPSEFLGKSFKEIFPPNLAELFMKQVSLCLEKKRIEIIEYPLIIKGKENFYESRAIPFSEDEVVAIVRNISSRKLWERKLKESEARFRTIAENALVGVYIREDKFIYVNPAFCKIFGYEENEIVGKLTLRDLTLEEDYERLDIDIKKRMESEKPERVETFRGKTKDGKIIYLETYSAIIDFLGRKAIMGIILDITERKKAEEEQKKHTETLKSLLDGIITAMAKIVEIKDPYTAGHQQRVSELATKIGEEMGLDRETIEAIRVAAMIHDIGKINIPAEILTKPGELSPLEREMIKSHPAFGFEILKNINFPWPIANIVLQHHEKIDGSGYPSQLKGDQIMLEARIISVADVVEAMSTHRPYRGGYGLAKALDEIIAYCGTWYDEKVVNVCLNLFKEKDFEFTYKLP